MAYAIRPYRDDDIAFLWEMLYQSIYIPAGEEQPGREILDDPAIAKYLLHWGRDSDRALIAVDEDGTPLGAIWMRVWPDAEHGWGYVDDETPELGMAICAEYRGRGLGGQLLRAIAAEAQQAGFRALSLSVDPRNAVALALYQRHGYQFLFEDQGGSWTMKRLL
jgi:ribosomal protein S18 acetylase RimI-like enzyme